MGTEKITMSLTWVDQRLNSTLRSFVANARKLLVWLVLERKRGVRGGIYDPSWIQRPLRRLFTLWIYIRRALVGEHLATGNLLIEILRSELN